MRPERLGDDPVPLGILDLEFAQGMLGFLEANLGVGGPFDVRRFPAGRANLTYLVVTPERELVVRRPPFGPIPPKAHDMEREYCVMSALSGQLAFVPRTVALCSDPAVTDRPFFVMERVHGFVLREEWPAFLPADGKLRERIARSFVAMMVELHGVAPVDVGLQSLGRPEGFMDRQVRSWAQRCRDSTVDDGDNGERIFQWLASQAIPPQGAAIIHNDLKFDNVMFDWDEPARIRAVFDWDMATLGDPLADLGLVLSYWGEPHDDPDRHGGRLPVSALDGFPRRSWVIDEYVRQTGRDVSAVTFYEVFGLAKLAVLCQQLFQRYRQGGSDDARLAIYETQVPAIWREARRRAGV